MKTNFVKIDSTQYVNSFDSHMKVMAGPGAGKTTWLVNQVKHIIEHSNNLHRNSKILCITYTNSAANSLKNKLFDLDDKFHSATIHSFLFAYIVKPYLHLLKKEDGTCLVNHSQVRTHSASSPNFGTVKEWVDAIDNKQSGKLPALNNKQAYSYIKACNWKLNNDEWSYAPNTFVNKPQYLPVTQLQLYKELQWAKGFIEHDDVIYFAYNILENYPVIAKYISAKFPYIFIDEFQDIDPRQMQIFSWLADVGGSKLIVIGDCEQSIYGFSGALAEHFRDYAPKDKMQTYVIENNWRSTDNIIKFLNHMRTDGIEQIGNRKIIGEKIKLVIGDHKKISKYIEQSSFENLTILARKNSYVSKFRCETANVNLWDQFENIDMDRALFFKELFEAYLLYVKKNYGLATKLLADAIKDKEGKSKIIKKVPYLTPKIKVIIAGKLLHFITQNYSDLADDNFDTLYSKISIQLNELFNKACLKVARANSKFDVFSKKIKNKELLANLNVFDDNRNIVTIHKAKGLQFKSVFIGLEEESDIEKILYPDNFSDSSSEEVRILYVALSRAEDNLIISIPSLREEDKQEILKMELPVEFI